MNDTAKIFALALASNHLPEQHFHRAFQTIQQWGEVVFSPTYLIPCRDGVGADYWNAACLLKSTYSELEIIQRLKKMEQDSGRIRPSHQISLDVDLIAVGHDLAHMQFNSKKMPLAVDVKIPLYDVWASEWFETDLHYPVIRKNIEMKSN